MGTRGWKVKSPNPHLVRTASVMMTVQICLQMAQSIQPRPTTPATSTVPMTMTWQPAESFFSRSGCRAVLGSSLARSDLGHDQRLSPVATATKAFLRNSSAKHVSVVSIHSPSGP